MEPTKNLVILANQRHGTHLLMGYAIANGYLEGYEPFGPKFGAFGARHCFKVLAGRNPAPTCYIVHQDQIVRHLKRDITLEELNQYFKAADYIHITRNIIHSSVSYHFSMTANQWRHREPNPTPTEADYDYDTIERYVIRFASRQWKSELLTGVEAMSITYNDLINNKETTLQNIFTTLNVDLQTTEQTTFYKAENPLKQAFITMFETELPIKNPTLLAELTQKGLI